MKLEVGRIYITRSQSEVKAIVQIRDEFMEVQDQKEGYSYVVYLNGRVKSDREHTDDVVIAKYHGGYEELLDVNKGLRNALEISLSRQEALKKEVEDLKYKNVADPNFIQSHIKKIAEDIFVLENSRHIQDLYIEGLKKETDSLKKLISEKELLCSSLRKQLSVSQTGIKFREKKLNDILDIVGEE